MRKKIAPISDKEKLKCITEYDGFGGKLSEQWCSGNISVRDGPLDDNFNEPIHESRLHMQDANKTKALSCVLTVN